MRYEFFGQSASDTDNKWANTSRLINCYREQTGGEVVIKSVLGATQVGAIPGVFCRAAATIDDMLYIAQGGSLYSVDESGTVTNLGSIADSSQTTISGNNGNVTVCAGSNYYVWNGTTLLQPLAGAFSDFGSVTFFGDLTVLTELDGERVQWSDPADPTTLDGLSFASARARDDKILRALPVTGALWVFGTDSIEPWGQNTAGDLQPIRGGTIETGLKAFNLIASIPNGCAFVGNDNKFRLVLGGGMQPVSTIAVETSISSETPSRVEYYQDEGHEMVALIFADRPAWVFDISAGEWHERAENNDDPWRVRGIARAFGKYYVCQDDGSLSVLERSNQDKDGPLIRTAIGRTIENDGNYFTVSKLEGRANVGRNELNSGDAPLLSLCISRDRGQTFTDPKPRSMGEIGQYDTRITWNALGRGRNFTPKLVWSDPVDANVAATFYMSLS